MIVPNVILVFGGTSDERRVSVASAQNIIRVLPQAVLWFIAPNGAVYECTRSQLTTHTRAFEVDFLPATPALYRSFVEGLDAREHRDGVYFLALHGGEGEDGTFQAELERRGLAFSGSGSLASRRAFDKRVAKQMVAERGIRVAVGLQVSGAAVLEARSAISQFFEKHGELILKPVAGGSSIGLYRLKEAAQLDSILGELRARPEIAYLVEPFIVGREITIGVCDNGAAIRALPPSEVVLFGGNDSTMRASI